MEEEFYIVPAFYDENTFFLFRDYGNEIKFTSKDGKISIVGKGYFTPKELRHLLDYFK